MNMIQKVGEFCTMMGYGGAFVPSSGQNGALYSAYVFFYSTEHFSTIAQFAVNTPLSLWQQRMIYLSPLVIKSLPSLNAPEVREHYPLLVYENIAKILLIVSVVIRSRQEGYHLIGGMCVQGGLIHACKNKYISYEKFLIICMLNRLISAFSMNLFAKSQSQRAEIFIGLILSQLMILYSFPIVKIIANELLWEKIVELYREDEEFRNLMNFLVKHGVIPQSWLPSTNKGNG